MKPLALLVAAAAAALVLAATTQAKNTNRSLSDAHVGSAPAELLAQQDHSRTVLAFFHTHHWMSASRHAYCAGVPWRQTCKVARRQVRLHRWLLRVATERYQRIAFSPQVVRAWVLKYHPCLDTIIQLEDRTYDPTISNGGGHGDTSIAYGLPQATPGTKMAWIGPDWRTNPYTQLKWMSWYTIHKFGSECAAAYARVHANMY